MTTCRVFIVTSENDCCGCDAPVYVGWYTTREEADAEVARLNQYAQVIEAVPDDVSRRSA